MRESLLRKLPSSVPSVEEGMTNPDNDWTAGATSSRACGKTVLLASSHSALAGKPEGARHPRT